MEYGVITEMWPLDIRGISDMEIGDEGYASIDAVTSRDTIDEDYRIYEHHELGNIVVRCVGAHQYSVTFPDLQSRRDHLRKLDCQFERNDRL